MAFEIINLLTYLLSATEHEEAGDMLHTHRQQTTCHTAEFWSTVYMETDTCELDSNNLQFPAMF